MGRVRTGDLTSSGAQRRQLERVFKKYRGVCQLCFKTCPRSEASREHVIDLSKGGSNRDSNVVLAHKHCNNRKSNAVGKMFTTQGGPVAASVPEEKWSDIVRTQIYACLIRQSFGNSPTASVARQFREDETFYSMLPGHKILSKKGKA